VNAFDASILLSLNEYARRWWTFDVGMVVVTDGYLLRGGVVVGGLWLLWFASRDHRSVVIRGAIGTVAAVAVTRALATLLPYRPRPIAMIDLALVPPIGMHAPSFDRLSAFPSDTATLFFALATVYWLIAFRWGVAAFAYVTAARVRALETRYPSYFYAAAFLASLETAELFDDSAGWAASPSRQ
jgi:undecaprenyl-diphosphatase